MDLRAEYQKTLNELAASQQTCQRLEGRLQLLAQQIQESEPQPAATPAPNRAERRRRGRPAAQPNGAALSA